MACEIWVVEEGEVVVAGTGGRRAQVVFLYNFSG